MGTILINLLIGVVAGIIVATLGIFLFNRDLFHRRLTNTVGWNLKRSFERINSRPQLLACFEPIFISNVSEHIGQIFLMSHTGGYPEYDPFFRLLELSGNNRLTVHAAMTEHTVKSYYNIRPDVIERIARAGNVHLYVFSDMTPYTYRIGVNTHLGLGFFCAYFGHSDNRVWLEGVKSNNLTIIGAIEALFWGLLRAATEVTDEWVSNLSARS